MQQQPPELNPDPMAGVVAELSKRLDSIERRLDRIETNQREGAQALRQHIDDGLGSVNQRMDDGLENVNRRIDTLTRWIIGIQLSSFIALAGLLVAILLKG